MKKLFLILFCLLTLVSFVGCQERVTINGEFLPVTWDVPDGEIPEGATLSYELFTTTYPTHGTLLSVGTTLALDYSVPLPVGVDTDIGVIAKFTYDDGHVETSDYLWSSVGGVNANKEPWPFYGKRYVKPNKVKAFRVKQ